MKKLSIIIPSYNYAHFLPTCLDSLLNQKEAFELIVVDDGSTDTSLEVLADYGRRHSNMRILASQKNEGIFQASLRGLREAEGDYIHFFSSDDYHLPGSLTQVTQLIEAKRPALVCTNLGFLKAGVVEEMRPVPGCTQPQYFAPEVLPKLMRQGFWVPGLTAFVRRDLLETYGTLDPKLENISDWFLYNKIALFEGVGYIPETLVIMRLHEKTYTSYVKKDKKRRRATYHYLLTQLLKDSATRRRFLASGLLDFILKELRWRLFLKPSYFPYWRRL